MEPTPVKKAVNRVKASIEQRRGPVEKDQRAAPIADAVGAYWERDTLTFGIPAHNGGRGPLPEVAKWAGLDAVRTDVSMSHGVDTRDRAWQVQSTAQQLFAEAVGAKQVLFSTNGSSMNVHVAVMTVAGPGDTLVLARNGHKSAFASLVLSGARPIYVDPYYDEQLEIALGPLPADFAAILDAHPEARAGLVFTPSYYGTSADVRALADACHERGIPLVTDDAWALDYAFADHPALPEGALAQGSDLAIGSVHKTLSGLAQTSVLSIGSDRIDSERLQLCFELEESTSASTLLLSSIDGARRQFVREGRELLDRAVKAARLLRERLAAEVPELRVIGVDELASRPGVTGVDPTHVLIETAPVGLTGYQADDWLRDERHVDVELVDHRRIMPLVSFAHGEQEIDRLVSALRDLVDEHGEPGSDTDVARLPSRRELRTEQAMLPRDAVFAATEAVKPRQAAGRISAELITPYPPGIPAIAPGELIDEPLIAYLEEIVANGAFLEGAADASLGSFRVVTE
ncbi:aminotransferase class I/II-fold pyridoxal phosphate-dependent enzyme [Candidatus Solirubrobacter pratensis]|uniref:aminotransferase class I/II-fold pyridoxal phosphate-dependent enzyme n=1 Tax=Candidatus Solirubrobacter pratensis TaxID=1298857 RepID=UPI000686D21A|nr:DegT/DnrJ/EryC1/StrS family aminotransferase [Candidatus Solirubrobacter pratensis]